MTLTLTVQAAIFDRFSVEENTGQSVEVNVHGGVHVQVQVDVKVNEADQKLPVAALVTATRTTWSRRSVARW
jgi:hypothetical protein